MTLEISASRRTFPNLRRQCFCILLEKIILQKSNQPSFWTWFRIFWAQESDVKL